MASLRCVVSAARVSDAAEPRMAPTAREESAGLTNPFKESPRFISALRYLPLRPFARWASADKERMPPIHNRSKNRYVVFLNDVIYSFFRYYHFAIRLQK